MRVMHGASGGLVMGVRERLAMSLLFMRGHDDRPRETGRGICEDRR